MVRLQLSNAGRHRELRKNPVNCILRLGSDRLWKVSIIHSSEDRSYKYDDPIELLSGVCKSLGYRPLDVLRFLNHHSFLAGLRSEYDILKSKSEPE